MNDNSKAIAVFCSSLVTENGAKPLTTAKWGKLAQQLVSISATPSDLLNFTLEDYMSILGYSESEALNMISLVSRSAALTFELNKLSLRGINIVTRADSLYPRHLKTKLGNSCPPLFYYSGNLDLLNEKYIGVVGSRDCDNNDEQFIRSAVKKALKGGYGIVSGGAKGADSFAAEEAILYGGNTVLFLADSMQKKLRDSTVISAVQNGSLLVLSETKPTAGFNTGMAMARNKYIYAQSDATIVAKTSSNEGGTWAGATECLKKQYATVYCHNKPEYPGNVALIKKGALPIDDDWDGTIVKTTIKNQKSKPAPIEQSEQLNLFGLSL